MTSKVTFARASHDDEADVRRLLREIPLGGAWSVALTREPHGFGGPHLPGERQQFVIARDRATGAAIGLCERVVRPTWVAGQQVALPYLGALRVAPSHRHNLGILKGGFALLREGEEADDLPVALTSITADNSPARRILTAGLRGLPDYRYLADFSTFAIRPRRPSRDSAIVLASRQEFAEIADFLGTELRRRDCAPVWDEAALAALDGVRFLVLREAGEIAGCVGVWDQRAGRQALLIDYPPVLRRLRGPANLVGRAIGLPRIPAVGRTIDQVFLSPAAVRDDDERVLIRLLRAGLGLVRELGGSAAIFGVPTGHRWHAAAKRGFRAIEYRTSLFAVRWPDDNRPAAHIDPETLFPEVGLL